MELDVLSYSDLLDDTRIKEKQNLENALRQKGIVGIRGVPEFEKKARAYIDAARKFSVLSEAVKQQYAPDRDKGDTEGYELGAEQFQNKEGIWHTDDKKASFYAYVPDRSCNKWPHEVDLRTPYLELGELIFKTGKLLLNVMGLNETVGLEHDLLTGYGRMLHYNKESDATNDNPNWCGAHLDHGVFTGLVPAYYFRDGKEVDEPIEAGLYIASGKDKDLEKMYASDKSVLLFQVGEFGQLLSNDGIQATRHMVKKAHGGIERFAFALFYSAHDDTIIKSSSQLITDARYKLNQSPDGSLSYEKWQRASFERYHATS